MYAVVANGGKQYKVEPGQVLRLEKMSGQTGDQIELGPVLMIGGEGDTKIGQPHLEAKVTAVVLEQGKSKKVQVLKKKRRKGYRVKRGHRQPFTAVRVQGIEA